MKPPRVEVCTENNTATAKSRFFLNFETGSYRYRTSVDGGETTEVDIKDWSVALFVTYDEHKLKEPPSGNDTLQSKWAALEPGGYSLSQVVFCLGSAPLASIDWPRCITPGLDPNQEPMKKLFFSEFMESYLAKLEKDPDALVLGYVVKAADPVKDEPYKSPTFPPTAVKHQNYAYRECSDALATIHNQPGSPEARNALLFLEMPAGDELQKSVSEPRGNLVIGGMPGGLAFAKRLFFDKYLKDTAFKDFNTSMVKTMNEMIQWIQNYARGKTDWYIDNKPIEELEPSLQWKSTDAGAEMKWAGLGRRTESVWHSGSWGYQVKSSLATTLVYEPGTNLVKVTANAKIDWDNWNKPTGGRGNIYHFIEAEIKLNITFALQSVQAGVLKVSVNEDLEECKCRDSAGKKNAAWLHWLSGPDNTKFADEMKLKLRDAVKIGHMGDVLAERINNQAQFVFPGSGVSVQGPYLL